MKNKGNAREKLLRELAEIKAVVEVEAKLMRTLVRMVLVRQTVGLRMA